MSGLQTWFPHTKTCHRKVPWKTAFFSRCVRGSAARTDVTTRPLLGSPRPVPKPPKPVSEGSPELPRPPEPTQDATDRKRRRSPEDVGRQPVGHYGGRWEQLTVPPKGKPSHHAAQKLGSWVRAQDQGNRPVQKRVLTRSRQHCPRPPRRGNDPAATAGARINSRSVPTRRGVTAGSRHPCTQPALQTHRRDRSPTRKPQARDSIEAGDPNREPQRRAGRAGTREGPRGGPALFLGAERAHPWANKTPNRPWPGSSAGQSVEPARQGSGSEPWSGHVRELTSTSLRGAASRCLSLRSIN